MPLVAMTLEMGSLGNDIAQGVAKELGQEVIHHEIIDHLADKMRVRKSHVVRFLDNKASILERLSPDRTSLSIYTAEKIYSIAQRKGGAVVHGWGVAQLLRPVGHTVCVRVCAPIKLRVKRMMERLNTVDEEFVRKEIDFSDEAHGAIIRRHFGVDWQDLEHYDLALNTERVPTEECVEEILGLVRKAAFEETPQSHAALDNLSLAAHVRAMLHTDPRTRKVNVTIESDAGHVTLSGIILDDIDLSTLTEIAAKVPGVNEVQNRVKLAKQPLN
jgi:cytidylate kinase